MDNDPEQQPKTQSDAGKQSEAKARHEGASLAQPEIHRPQDYMLLKDLLAEHKVPGDHDQLVDCLL